MTGANARLKIKFSQTILILTITIVNWFLVSDAVADQNRKIYYVVDSEIYSELQAEISQFIADVSLDTDAQNKLIISDQNQTALEIRQTLSNAFKNDNLWGVFLIGRITPAYIRYPGSAEQLSDHPYISYECPYTEEDNNGIFEAASNFSIIPACMPDIWLARIYPSRENEEGINQIRSYLSKNHLLRNESSYFEKKIFYHSSIGIAEEGKTYDDFVNIFSGFLTDHPLSTLDDLTISYDTGVNEQIDSFLNGFESKYEIMNINNHGAPTLLEFKECEIISPTWKECFAVDISSTELAEKTSHVKLIDLDSCSNGRFTAPDYFAGEALFSGDTLLVIANPEDTVYFSDNLEKKFKTSYYGLGLGFSNADLYTYIDPGHPRHFFGDPTIIFRQKDMTSAPGLAINGTALTGPTKYELDFGDAVNESSETVTVSLSNQGESTLRISGRWVSDYISYNDTSSPGTTNGFIFSITDPIYLDFDFEESLPAGESKELTFTFNPTANGDNPGTAKYKGVFKFMTNDPNVGSFQILTIGNHVIDTDNDNMPDDWELKYFGDTERDGNGDYDNDGLIDVNEYKYGTNPTLIDTDSDGISDGEEDSNNNGLKDTGETDPTDSDTDNDGMVDGWEVEYGLNPLVDDADEDADGDGFSNLKEYQRETDPNDYNSHPSKGMPWLQLLLEDN